MQSDEKDEGQKDAAARDDGDGGAGQVGETLAAGMLLARVAEQDAAYMDIRACIVTPSCFK
eukprot:812088-Prymnesium_polylepis.1